MVAERRRIADELVLVAGGAAAAARHAAAALVVERVHRVLPRARPPKHEPLRVAGAAVLPNAKQKKYYQWDEKISAAQQTRAHTYIVIINKSKKYCLGLVISTTR